MRLLIGYQFSYEISDGYFCTELSTKLSDYFGNRDYGKIQTVYCDVICVSEEFAPFFLARPLKILRKEPAIVFEYTLDFEKFKSMSQNEREKYIVYEYLQSLEEIVKTKKIKDFDLPRLLTDLHSFFRETRFIEIVFI